MESEAFQVTKEILACVEAKRKRNLALRPLLNLDLLTLFARDATLWHIRASKLLNYRVFYSVSESILRALQEF